jgi:ABC-2 type transport system ATP-binding protein
MQAQVQGQQDLFLGREMVVDRGLADVEPFGDLGELSGMRTGSARARAAELVELFELAGVADRVVKGYSGGMRRRLDLAASLLTRPPVLFLDEPTTGLDPVSRQRVWEVIRDLIGSGVTLLLTTQYLDEADALVDHIVVVNHGQVIADGTPRELKQRSRSAHVEVTLAEPGPEAAEVIAPLVGSRVSVSAAGLRLGAAADSAPGLATAVVRALDQAGMLVDNIEVRQPSLDDVFFALTGARGPEEDPEEGPQEGPDVAAGGAGRPVPGGSADGLPVRGRGRRHRAGGRLENQRGPAVDHRGLRPRTVLHLLAVVGYRVRRAQEQEPGVGRLVRTHRAVPARVRVQRDGADPAHARLAAGRRRLEPGQRGDRRRPPALAQPEPVRAIGAWPMQHPIEASLAWSALILAVAAPLESRYFRRRTTE